MISIIALFAWVSPDIGSDPRLARPIQIAEFGRDAPTLCADLGKLAGVPITCDPLLGDDLIFLVVKHRPAAEIMAKVASTFGWTWQPSKSGYRLTPSTGFVNRARDGRREILIAKGRVWQGSAKKRLRDGVGFRRGISDQELLLLTQICELTDDQLAVLPDRRLIFSSQPTELEAPFGSQSSSLFAKLRDNFQPLRFLNGSEGTTTVTALQGCVLQVDAYDKVRLTDKYTDDLAFTEPFMDFDEPRLPTTPLPPKIRQAFLHSANVDDRPDSRRSFQGDQPLRPFLLKFADVAKQLDADLISDAYDDYASVFGFPEDIKDDLDRLVSGGFQPTLSGNWVINRSRDWPRARAESVPRRLLGPFYDQAIATESLEAQAARWSQLTPAQLKSSVLPSYAKYFWFYRLWNDLDLTIRGRLAQGDKLPLTILPASALDFLYAKGEEPSNGPNQFNPLLSSREFSEPEFIDYGPLLQSQTEHGGVIPALDGPFRHALNDFADLYPRLIAADATVSEQTVTIPAMYDGDENLVLSPGDLADEEAGQEHPPAIKHPRAAAIEAHRFRFVLRKNVEVFADVSVATIGEPLPSNPEKWPSDLRDRVAKQVAIERAMFMRPNIRP